MFEFSDRTKEILSNFSSINNGMLFREGNSLTVISNMGDVFAKAAIVETIPKEFAIKDVSKFLGILTQFKTPFLTFQEHFLTIQQGERKLKFVYTNPKALTIAGADGPKNRPPAVTTFPITKEQFAELSKVVRLMKFSTIVIEGDGDKVVIRAIDSKNPTSDEYSNVLMTSSKTFKIMVATERFLVPIIDNYELNVGEDGNLFLTSSDITYDIAVDLKV